MSQAQWWNRLAAMVGRSLGMEGGQVAGRPMWQGMETLERRAMLVVALPEIAIYSGASAAVEIVDNDLTPARTDYTDFGPMSVAGGSVTRTYRVWNIGSETLTLGAAPVTLSGSQAADFAVIAAPAATVAAGEYTTFTIRFDPSAAGTRSATVTIASDDADEGTFDFRIQGTGLNMATFGYTADPATDLRAVITTKGTGAQTSWGSKLSMRYTGFLTDGTVFDSNVNGNLFSFTLGYEQVIPGWEYGLNGAKVGESRTLIIPAGLGYRDVGSPPIIPGNATLIFETTVVAAAFPDAKLMGNSTEIRAGDSTPAVTDHTDFGAVSLRGDQRERTIVYTLTNAGPAGTWIFRPNRDFVTVSGVNAGDFTVGTVTESNVANEIYIPITFKPTAAGVRNATVTLHTFDPDEYSYAFAVRGTGIGPQLAITAPDQTAAEKMTGEGVDTATFRISAGGLGNAGLEVAFALSGAARRREDYLLKVGEVEVPGNTVTIPAGQTYVDVTVAPINDARVEPAEAAVLTLRSSSNYTLPALEADRKATVTIADNEPTVSVIAEDGAAAETVAGNGVNTGTFRLSRTGHPGEALTVNFTLAGTARRGTDYVTLRDGDTPFTTSTVTIPAGQEYVDVTILPTDDTQPESAETVILTLARSDSYTLDADLADQRATVEMADNEPNLSIAAQDPTAAETVAGNDMETGHFRITRTGNAIPTLTVGFSVSGTARRGEDYLIKRNGVIINGNNFVLESGDTSADLIIEPMDDTRVELAETVILTLSSAAAYAIPAVEADRRATVTILENEPTLSLTAMDVAAAETMTGQDAATGMFRIMREGNRADPLTVNIRLGGDARRGGLPDGDYLLKQGDLVITGNTLVFPAGEDHVDLTVTPVNDGRTENAEPVILTLQSGATYALPVDRVMSTATVTIADNEPTLAISAPQEWAGEMLDWQGGIAGTIRIARTGHTGDPLTVNFNVSGSASRGTLPNGDYLLKIGDVVVTGSSFEIPAGQDHVDVSVLPLDDGRVENLESMQLQLQSAAAYRLPAAQAEQRATVMIVDLGVPIVSVTANKSSTSERDAGVAGRQGQYTFTRVGGNIAQPVTVRYVMTGTATNSADYTELTGEATIPANQTSVTVDVLPVDDLLSEAAETAVLTMTLDQGYRIATGRGSATVTMADYEISPSSLDGKAFSHRVTAGTGAHADNVGDTATSYFGSGKWFSFDSGVDPFGGTFEYEQLTTTSARVVLHDPDDQVMDDGLNQWTVMLTFTSATGGTMTTTFNDGTESGTFTLATPTGDYAPASLNGQTYTSKITKSPDASEVNDTSRVEMYATHLVVVSPEFEAETLNYTYQRLAPNFGLVQVDDGDEDFWVGINFTKAGEGSFCKFTLDGDESEKEVGTWRQTAMPVNVAPYEIGGIASTFTATGGTGTRERSNTMQMMIGLPGLQGNDFFSSQMWDGNPGMGNLTFTCDATNHGVMVVQDVRQVESKTYILTFTTATQGTFFRETSDGTQWGTFRLAAATGDFAPADLDGMTFNSRVTKAKDAALINDTQRLEFTGTQLRVVHPKEEVDLMDYTYWPIAPNFGIVDVEDGENDFRMGINFTAAGQGTFVMLHAGGDMPWESGEWRQTAAVTNVAPDALGGSVMNVSIKGGTGTRDRSGSVQVLLGSNTNDYFELNNDPWAGTYSYVRDAANHAVLSITELDEPGSEKDIIVTFTSATRGTWYNETNDGTQWGDFTLAAAGNNWAPADLSWYAGEAVVNASWHNQSNGDRYSLQWAGGYMTIWYPDSTQEVWPYTYVKFGSDFGLIKFTTDQGEQWVGFQMTSATAAKFAMFYVNENCWERGTITLTV